MTGKEVDCIRALIDEGTCLGWSVPEIARRIHREMPHLAADEIAKVAGVHAEMLRADAAELNAGAEASKQMAELLRAAGRLTGITDPTIEKVEPVLIDKAMQGDEEAANLLAGIKHTLPLTALGD
jgi:hypothetical protein